MSKSGARTVPAIVDAIRSLAHDPVPHGARKMAGAGKPGPGRGALYRIRVGSYRVGYEVISDLQQVYIHKIAHRQGIYLNWP